MNKKRLTMIITGLMVTISTVYSATVVKMDIDDLTKRSDVAVVGKVDSISNQNQGDYPETLFHVTVLETFYGSEEMTDVTLCLPGGPAGNGLTTFVPGMPKFKVGEKVVLFLVLDQDRGVAVPTGLEQGVFRVRTNPDTKEEYVVNQTVDLKLNTIGSSAGQKIKSPSLSNFAKTIKAKAKELKKKE